MDKTQLPAEAQRIIDNPALPVILRRLEEDAIQQLMGLQAGEDAARLALSERIKLIRDFPSELARAAKLPSEPKGGPHIV